MTTTERGLLARKLGDRANGPSLFDVLGDSLHSSKSESRRLGLAAGKIRQVAVWFEQATGSRRVADRNVDLVMRGEDGGVTQVHTKIWAETQSTTEWRQRAAVQRSLRSHFERVKEYVGRVREIDREANTFTAVLGSREADPHHELVATFDHRLVGGRQFDRLAIGSTFTLVTGYRIQLGSDGKPLSSSLDTSIVVHRSRPVSSRRHSAALAEAIELLED